MQKERKTEEEEGGLCERRFERDCQERCTAELHGGDYRPISTLHRSEIKKKK